MKIHVDFFQIIYYVTIIFFYFKVILKGGDGSCSNERSLRGRNPMGAGLPWSHLFKCLCVTWHLKYDMWQVSQYTQKIMNIVSNLQVPSSYGLGMKFKKNVFKQKEKVLCVMYQVPGFSCQISGIGCWCHILIMPAARATTFSVANCTTLKCRTGQLVKGMIDGTPSCGKTSICHELHWTSFKKSMWFLSVPHWISRIHPGTAQAPHM